MQKRVIIVHGWGGYPGEGWFPWLKKELETRVFRVDVPRLPKPEAPRIQSWVPKLAEVVGNPNENTFFVGHSMGVQTIARYLETLPDGIKIGGTAFVAGFFKRLTGLGDDPEVQKTDEHWLKTPIDLKKVHAHLPKSVAIFSDDDPWVPLDNQDDFKEKLNSKIIIEHKMGHFTESDGVEKLPIVLKSLLEMANNKAGDKN